jgi:hypothetical protein
VRAVTTRKGNVVRPPTDFDVLRRIYETHLDDFKARKGPGTGRAFIQVDIPAIAAHFNVDENLIFGRLYYHLEPKYGEPERDDGKARKAFFSMTPLDGQANVVNFPMLESVLAGLWADRRRDLGALWASAYRSGSRSHDSRSASGPNGAGTASALAATLGWSGVVASTLRTTTAASRGRRRSFPGRCRHPDQLPWRSPQ